MKGTESTSLAGGYKVEISFLNIIYVFFAYSMLGWVWESIYESILNRKILNRGFFNGPYIPLYGFGGVGCFVVLQRFQAPLKSPETLKIYIIGAVGATVLEYVTSYVLEKTLKARWWDYTNYPLNINGRICLIATVFWGAVAIGAIDYLNPFLFKVKEQFSHDSLLIVLTFLVTTFFYDFCITINSILDLQKKIQLIISMEKDNVFEAFAEKKEAFAKYRDRFMEIQNPFITRIIRNFPNLRFVSKNVQGVFTKIKEHLPHKKDKDE